MLMTIDPSKERLADDEFPEVILGSGNDDMNLMPGTFRSHDGHQGLVDAVTPEGDIKAVPVQVEDDGGEGEWGGMTVEGIPIPARLAMKYGCAVIGELVGFGVRIPEQWEPILNAAGGDYTAEGLARALSVVRQDEHKDDIRASSGGRGD